MEGKKWSAWDVIEWSAWMLLDDRHECYWAIAMRRNMHWGFYWLKYTIGLSCETAAEVLNWNCLRERKAHASMVWALALLDEEFVLWSTCRYCFSNRFWRAALTSPGLLLAILEIFILCGAGIALSLHRSIGLYCGSRTNQFTRVDPCFFKHLGEISQFLLTLSWLLSQFGFLPLTLSEYLVEFCLREGANKSYGTRAFTGNPLILND